MKKPPKLSWKAAHDRENAPQQCSRYFLSAMDFFGIFGVFWHVYVVTPYWYINRRGIRIWPFTRDCQSYQISHDLSCDSPETNNFDYSRFVSACFAWVCLLNSFYCFINMETFALTSIQFEHSSCCQLCLSVSRGESRQIVTSIPLILITPEAVFQRLPCATSFRCWIMFTVRFAWLVSIFLLYCRSISYYHISRSTLYLPIVCQG